MKNIVKIILISVLFAVMIISCQPNVVYDNTKEEAQEVYIKNHPFDAPFNIGDNGNNNGNNGDNGGDNNGGNNNNGDNGNNNNDSYTPYTSAGMPQEMVGYWVLQSNESAFYINDDDTINYYNETISNYDIYYVINCDSTSLTLEDSDETTYNCSYTISGNTMTWTGDLYMTFTKD